jgi:hypothetical protein
VTPDLKTLIRIAMWGILVWTASLPLIFIVTVMIER